MTATPPTLPVTQADLLRLAEELVRLVDAPREPGRMMQLRRGVKVLRWALAEWADQERRGELCGELPY